MSFNVSFFARDAGAAQAKLREAYAPAAVKAVIELAIAGIPQASPSVAGAGQQTTAVQGSGDNAKAVNRPAPRLCGILVETHGHIDEHGGRSGINVFRVEPYYD